MLCCAVRGGSAVGGGTGHDARGAVVWTSGPSSKSPPVLAKGPPPSPTALGAPSPPAPGAAAPSGGAGTGGGACGLGGGAALLLPAPPWDSGGSPPAVQRTVKTFEQALVRRGISAISHRERKPRRDVGHVHALHLSLCTSIPWRKILAKPGS